MSTRCDTVHAAGAQVVIDATRVPVPLTKQELARVALVRLVADLDPPGIVEALRVLSGCPRFEQAAQHALLIVGQAGRDVEDVP